MSLESEQNHYQVLGLERAADERAIKKAYFALVRKFPPDVHPEEFKKIRAAYEVLSDPLARRRFDAKDPDYAEHGASTGATLRAAAQASREGNHAQAQQYLRDLLAQEPELLVAREMLGQSYMRSGNFPSALAQFDALVSARPGEAQHHLRRGYALRAQDKAKDAMDSFRKARELRPDDVEIRMALADSFADSQRFDEALVEIQAALAQIPDEPGPRLHIELRRLDVLFLKKGGAPALRELDSFVGRVRKDPDKEFWKYASSQLAALATRLFARQSCDDANEILARCARLNPGSLVEHPYPEKTTVELSALPARSRAWLASLEGGQQSPTLLRAIWGGSLWGLIGAVALATFTVYVLFDSPRAWGVPGYVFALVCFVGSGLALAASARAVVSAATSEVRPLVTIHPLYLLQTTARQVKVWPLVNLLSVNLTRHSTNGVYTHTQVAAKFGRSSFSTMVRDEAYAKKWADYLLETRRRVLDLLHHGYLEAEPNVDLLPPKLLQPRKERRFQAWRPDRWLQVGAGTGFALFLAAIPWNARLVDEADFGAATRVGTAKAYGTYLKQHATGRFVESAKAEIARRYDAAWTSLELGRGPEAPGLDALRAGLTGLAEAGQTSLPLVMTWEVGDDVAAAASNDAALEEAVGSAALAQRGRELEGRIRQGLQAMGLAEVAALERKATAPPTTPLALTVHARYGLDGSVLEAGAIRVSGLRVDWKVALEGTAVRGSRFAWEAMTTAPIALDLTGTAAAGGGRAAAYAAELDAACADFSGRLGEALGFGALRLQPSVAPVRKTALLSPYKK